MKNLITLIVNAKAEDFKVALVIFLCLAAMGIWILYEASNAPEGYQDETGFHYDEEKDLDQHEKMIS